MVLLTVHAKSHSVWCSRVDHALFASRCNTSAVCLRVVCHSHAIGRGHNTRTSRLVLCSRTFHILVTSGNYTTRSTSHYCCRAVVSRRVLSPRWRFAYGRLVLWQRKDNLWTHRLRWRRCFVLFLHRQHSLRAPWHRCRCGCFVLFNWQDTSGRYLGRHPWLWRRRYHRGRGPSCGARARRLLYWL